MPARKVQLFHWNSAAFQPLVKKIEAAGYEVILHTQGAGLSVRKMQEASAVVIDLSRLPSHGRAVAAWLRGSKSTRQIPIVFVNGEPDKVQRVKQDVPDAVYTSTAGIVPALKTVRAPAQPVIPPQMMQSNRSTAQKLGIIEGSSVALIDPPADYIKVLGTLPDGVTFSEDEGAPRSVTLWFIHDAGGYAAGLPSRKKLAARSKLWVVWKKGQSRQFNGNHAREAALALGLVDYKICSLDSTWSGMAFAIKKGL